MLTLLTVRNIVLVEQAQIPFTLGLCVLTGETGAGKSILLDALGLALGRRAEARLVRAGAKEGSVTACFDLSAAAALRARLDALGMGTQGNELIVRRVLSAEGKSRCFVNDAPVSVSALKQLGEGLVEVHGQHDQRGLLDAGGHLDVLDAYGNLQPGRAAVAEAHSHWRACEAKLAALREQQAEAAREQEFLAHLVEELSTLAAEPGEAERLAGQRSNMMQGEKLTGTLQEALGGLQTEPSAISMLRDIQRLLIRHQPKENALFDGVIDALERAQLEAQQAESQLEHLLEASAYDPQELERIEERLFAIRAAARKYQCEADELSALCKRSQVALQSLENTDAQCAKLEREITIARTAYEQAAQALSAERADAARRLEKALAKELAPLKMDKCRFRVVLDRLDETQWSARGVDRVVFEVATNAGQPFAPLHRIASGGELSRFMLALKVVLSSVKSMPTLIFDEIDTGTGGAVADAIGARLALLAQRSQVLVVTHLPQVAARGKHHLFIAKDERDGHTHTQIRALDETERTEELARMLAGAEVTDEARGAAQKLLDTAG